MAPNETLTRDELQAALAKFPQKRIGVYGDHCLDRYMVGRMDAISRDAPVPIVRLYSDRYAPGGGGNVAANARALGADVYALGAIGGDVSSDILRACYAQAGINHEFLLSCPGRHVVAFNKVYAASSHGDPQQVARFDQENTTPLPEEAEAQVKQLMTRVVPELDAVLICDYEEVAGTGAVTCGALAHLGSLARKHGVLLAADSRMRVHQLGPVDIAVPNDLEAAAAVGLVESGHRGEISEEMVVTAGKTLPRDTGVRHLIITRGEQGMTVFDQDSGVTNVPARPAPPPIDVTGAGDTVLAAVALACVAGLPIAACAQLANAAAYVTIHKLNATGSVTPAELLQVFDGTR